MATQKVLEVNGVEQGENQPEPKKKRRVRRYYIVNPAGAIHEVSKEHAAGRVKTPGYRMATAAEVRKLKAAGGHQVFDKPLCEPWNPEPEGILEEVEGVE